MIHIYTILMSSPAGHGVPTPISGRAHLPAPGRCCSVEWRRPSWCRWSTGRTSGRVTQGPGCQWVDRKPSIFPWNMLVSCDFPRKKQSIDFGTQGLTIYVLFDRGPRSFTWGCLAWKRFKHQMSLKLPLKLLLPRCTVMWAGFLFDGQDDDQPCNLWHLGAPFLFLDDPIRGTPTSNLAKPFL